jgi:hypothetical protein
LDTAEQMRLASGTSDAAVVAWQLHSRGCMDLFEDSDSKFDVASLCMLVPSLKLAVGLLRKSFFFTVCGQK